MAIVRDPDEPATVVSLWLVALLMVVLAVVLLAIFYGFAVRHWFDFDKPAVAAPASQEDVGDHGDVVPSLDLGTAGRAGRPGGHDRLPLRHAVNDDGQEGSDRQPEGREGDRPHHQHGRDPTRPSGRGGASRSRSPACTKAARCSLSG